MVLKRVIDLESDLLIEIYSTRDEIKIFKSLNLTQYLGSYTHLKWLHFMCKKKKYLKCGLPGIGQLNCRLLCKFTVSPYWKLGMYLTPGSLMEKVILP